MKAVGYLQSHPIDHAESLLDLSLPAPEPGPRDLLVEVRAVSVNPVDAKVRQRRASADGVTPVVLGWDAVGVVRAIGAQVRGFAVGDRVWYAGDITRPGSNAELQCVDHRIASHAPRSLSDAEAAALPLTAITAWELLFDRLGVQAGESATLLATGAAGGVGSVLVQLARARTVLTVVGSASRAETRAWLKELGAHHVVDHTQPLVPQLAAIEGLPPLRYAASLTHTPQHYAQLVEALVPQGRLGVIDDFAAGEVDVMALKGKALSLHWEMMFARSLHQTPDMAEQGRLLAEVARLVDEGVLRSTASEVLGPIDAATLRRAHALIESGRTRGKLVLEGFGD
ncbi:zinc-binding alcohol dehydrogenase family protein [Caldimonas sp. KR1-144]|uniref:zinc-binding alcohol dehydrogenase family protein n=1 Tax=Caldimonas sp. KR1-144 TaxID=3400911 RepID=UPI003C023873